MADEKYVTTKPTTQLDLEARREANYQRAAEVTGDAGSPYAVEGNDTTAYLGVDTDRRTYASDTEKPLKGDGLEDKVNDEDLEVSYDDPEGKTPENPEGDGSEQSKREDSSPEESKREGSSPEEPATPTVPKSSKSSK